MKNYHGFKLKKLGSDECMSLSIGRICDPRTGAQGEVIAYFTSFEGKPIIITHVEYDTWDYGTTEVSE